MPHATLSVKVNHVYDGRRYQRGEVYEFSGSKEDLAELVEGGLVETEANLGRSNIAKEVQEARDEARLERSARLERDQRIVDLTDKLSTLEAEKVIMTTFASELRAMLGIGEEDSVLAAVKALVSGDTSEVVKERDELATEVELLRDQVTGYSAQNAEIRKLLKLSDEDPILEAIKVLGEPKKK